MLNELIKLAQILDQIGPLKYDILKWLSVKYCTVRDFNTAYRFVIQVLGDGLRVTYYGFSASDFYNPGH